MGRQRARGTPLQCAVGRLCCLDASYRLVFEPAVIAFLAFLAFLASYELGNTAARSLICLTRSLALKGSRLPMTTASVSSSPTRLSSEETLPPHLARCRQRHNGTWYEHK